jgi:hypothetical protein
MHEKGNPETRVAQSAQHEPCGKESQQGENHQVAHLARPGRTDEDAVITEGEYRQQRRGHHKPEIVLRGLLHVIARGHGVDQPRTEQRKHQRDHDCKAESPREHQTNRIGEGAPVAGPTSLPAQLLGGVSKPIKEERADQKEIVQHGVGGEDHVTGARTLRGKKQERGNQRRGADHDVTVDRQHAPQLGAIE